MNNNTEYIARYLQNDITDEERIAFEKQLAVDKNLQQELFIQQQIMKAAETGGLKNEFSKAIRKKIITQRLLQWGLVAAVLIGAFVFYAIKTDLFSKHTTGTVIGTPEKFVINNAADTIIETKDGVVFAIPAKAFNSNSSTIRLEIKTALNANDIMQQGLSTMSNGSLLETGGMFYINGYDENGQVSLAKNINVSVPTATIDPAMQLFKGVEDTNGHINWTDPKPVENKLLTYDITSLDFYPPDYIPTVKALGKDHGNKRYTDSLYYSFSGRTYGKAAKTDTLGMDMMISSADPAPAMRDAPKGPVYPLPDTMLPQDQFRNTKQDTTNKIIYDLAVADTLGRFFSYSDSLPDTYYHYELDPSRIRAIWNKKFNNTILATKEFEERLKYIHTLCDEKYLDAYIHGLDRPMHEIDQLCAMLSEGAVREKFLEFAARKDGVVRIKDGMQEKLSNYFQKKFEAYQQAVAKTMEKHEAELKKLAQIADDKKREQETKEFIREDENFQEEYSANLNEAYRQVGTPPTNYYNVDIVVTGWYNLDKYVFDATVNRQTMNYTDPVTGKTATLTYKDVSISIEGMADYDKVFVYLIPDSLSSFQRIEQQGNNFKESLNSLFRYDAVAIGFKGTERYFYRQTNLQAGEYSFNLSIAKDKELKQMLKDYSRQKSRDLKTEIEYRLFEQQEAARQVQLRKDAEFREQIAQAIFKCLEIGPTTSPVAPLRSK